MNSGRRHGHSCAYIGQEQGCRKFLEAILWIAPSGAQWRLIPRAYGDWNTVYKRFARWTRRGIFERLHQSSAGDADMGHLLIDRPLFAFPVRRQRLKQIGGQGPQELGRSRGWFSVKIHITVDVLGNPPRLTLTAGQRHDSPQAARLIENFEPRVLIADKSYDSDAYGLW